MGNWPLEAADKARAEARRAADVELADARNEAMRRLDEERSRLEAQMNRNAVGSQGEIRLVESSVVDLDKSLQESTARAADAEGLSEKLRKDLEAAATAASERSATRQGRRGRRRARDGGARRRGAARRRGQGRRDESPRRLGGRAPARRGPRGRDWNDEGAVQGAPGQVAADGAARQRTGKEGGHARGPAGRGARGLGREFGRGRDDRRGVAGTGLRRDAPRRRPEGFGKTSAGSGARMLRTVDKDSMDRPLDDGATIGGLLQDAEDKLLAALVAEERAALEAEEAKKKPPGAAVLAAEGTMGSRSGRVQSSAYKKVCGDAR